MKEKKTKKESDPKNIQKHFLTHPFLSLEMPKITIKNPIKDSLCTRRHDLKSVLNPSTPSDHPKAHLILSPLFFSHHLLLQFYLFILFCLVSKFILKFDSFLRSHIRLPAALLSLAGSDLSMVPQNAIFF